MGVAPRRRRRSGSRPRAAGSTAAASRPGAAGRGCPRAGAARCRPTAPRRSSSARGVAVVRSTSDAPTTSVSASGGGRRRQRVGALARAGQHRTAVGRPRREGVHRAASAPGAESPRQRTTTRQPSPAASVRWAAATPVGERRDRATAGAVARAQDDGRRAGIELDARDVHAEMPGEERHLERSGVGIAAGQQLLRASRAGQHGAQAVREPRLRRSADRPARGRAGWSTAPTASATPATAAMAAGAPGARTARSAHPAPAATEHAGQRGGEHEVARVAREAVGGHAATSATQITPPARRAPASRSSARVGARAATADGQRRAPQPTTAAR